jgi:hypothetical protein
MQNTATGGARRDRELQPCEPWKFHFCPQPQKPPVLDFFYPPKIQGITRNQRVRVATTSAQTHTAH